MKPKAYAGIGSRKTPEKILELMTLAAGQFSEEDLILRSGGADGADTAFEIGAYGAKEIYLPWQGFNNRYSPYNRPSEAAFDLAKQYHPAWENLSQAGQKLMARNCHQVLGQNLDDPVAFILCWTPKGSGSGGTGQAIRLARAYSIPVFDMGGSSLDEIQEGINQILSAR